MNNIQIQIAELRTSLGRKIWDLTVELTRLVNKGGDTTFVLNEELEMFSPERDGRMTSVTWCRLEQGIGLIVEVRYEDAEESKSLTYTEVSLDDLQLLYTELYHTLDELEDEIEEDEEEGDGDELDDIDPNPGPDFNNELND
jgi:hypothetical protein